MSTVRPVLLRNSGSNQRETEPTAERLEDDDERNPRGQQAVPGGFDTCDALTKATPTMHGTQ